MERYKSVALTTSLGSNKEAVKESGKDVDDIGMIDKPKEGSMGLCTNELIAPLVKAIQELSAKVAALEAA